MSVTDEIDTTELIKKARDASDKETYRPLQKTPLYRIGVGARVPPPNAPSFFVEIIVALSDKTKKVDLPRLEKILEFLKKLQAKNYTLQYENDNCISCETEIEQKNLNQEYDSIKILTKNIFA
jgi:hypothetical protein